MKKTKIWDLTFFSKKNTHKYFFGFFEKSGKSQKNRKMTLFIRFHTLKVKNDEKNFATFSTRFFAKSCKIFKMLILYYNIKCDISHKKILQLFTKKFFKKRKIYLKT